MAYNTQHHDTSTQETCDKTRLLSYEKTHVIQHDDTFCEPATCDKTTVQPKVTYTPASQVEDTQKHKPLYVPAVLQVNCAQTFTRKQRKFFRWWRLLPILCMLCLAAASFAAYSLPQKLMRYIYPVKYSQAIVSSAKRHNVDPYLLCAVIKSESSWNNAAQSHAGAKGLMQLMPQTAQEMVRLGKVNSKKYDPNNLSDPTTNIEFGAAYLSYLQSKCQTQEEVIAAYNAGLAPVRKWKQQPGSFSQAIEYPETQIYLKRVNNALQEYKKLYPEGIDHISQ